MSATGRSGIRLKDDFYQTPAWAYDWFMPELRQVMAYYPRRILEPGAGAGNLVRCLHGTWPKAQIVAVEKREECKPILEEAGASVIIDDFVNLKMENWEILLSEGSEPFDLVFGNPPYGGKKGSPTYGIWMKFVERGMDLLAHTGMLVFLLRLPALETKERNRWIRENMPDVYVLPKRPSFTGKGSDATAYAWMVWHKEWWESGKHTSKIMVLEDWRLR